MSRVGFTIHGFGDTDDRAYFPFEFTEVDPAYSLAYYRPALDLPTAFDYICKVRRLRCSIDITVLDDVVSPSVNVNVFFSQSATRVMTASVGDEQGIQEGFGTTGAWPEWQYDSSTITTSNGTDADVSVFCDYGSTGDVPLVYSGTNSFANYLFSALTVVGGDLGDRQNIAVFSTYQDTGYVVSSVTGTFMGKPFLVYRDSLVYNRDGTGTIIIEAIDYWSYNGIWDTTTGAQQITPIPEGF